MDVNQHKIPHHHHKLIMGLSAIVIFFVGLLIGNSLESSLGSSNLESVKIALLFSSIMLLLMIGNLVAEIKHILLFPKKGK